MHTPLSSIIVTSTHLLLTSLTLHATPLSQEVARNASKKIDTFLTQHLEKQKLPANPIIDDATFARRAYLKIIGRIPSADEARAFLKNTSSQKRSDLINHLVDSHGYKNHMFNFWADLLRLQVGKEPYGLGWHLWIRSAVDNNMPYDQFVNTMLSASGLATKHPEVGYYLRDRNMQLDNVSNTVQVFLGNQIGCAQCHDHPFDDWTQKQYYQLAAFTGTTQYKSKDAQNLISRLTQYTLSQQGTLPANARKKDRRKYRSKIKTIRRDYYSLFKNFRKLATFDQANKPLRLPNNYQYNDGKPGDIVKPHTLFGKSINTDLPPEKLRKAFANWVTAPDNPYFTKVIVNRLWAHAFGRGIVDPLDDWSETTRVSHPELLNYLCKIMQDTHYDVREFLRILYHTQLFERAVASQSPPMGGSYDFQGPILKRMSAEQIHDSLLLLEYGNQDHIRNKKLKERWDKFAHNINELITMPLPKLVELNKKTDKKEKESSPLRLKIRQLKKAIDKARGDGNLKLARQLSKEKKRYSRARKHMVDNMDDPIMSTIMTFRINTKTPFSLPSSEQPAPYKPASFMRQFGSSDRKTPNASSDAASIPQILTLYNGSQIHKLTDGKGALVEALKKSPTPSEKLNTLFLSIYGTFPNNSEKENYTHLLRKRRSTAIFVRAMISSKRFLFIQ